MPGDGHRKVRRSHLTEWVKKTKNGWAIPAMALLHSHRIKPVRCSGFFPCLSVLQETLLCFAHQPDFGYGQPPKLQNMTKALFLVVKLYINERNQLHIFNSQAAETLINEFKRDTPEAAKSDLFYSCFTILAAFFFSWFFYPCCRSTNVEYGCLKNGNFYETPSKKLSCLSVKFWCIKFGLV